MTAQISHLPADTSQEALLRCMAEDGAVIIDDALSGERLEALDNDLSPFLKKEVYGRDCLLYTSPSPRDATLSRMPSSA